jgi:hypothetical protein
MIICRRKINDKSSIAGCIANLYLYFICVEIQNENKVMMGEKGI